MNPRHLLRSARRRRSTNIWGRLRGLAFGHVRDLPGQERIGRSDANFQMIWEIDPKANSRLNDIARALRAPTALILATDPDREGEASRARA
jgi:DNA topoisomerase IA